MKRGTNMNTIQNQETQLTNKCDVFVAEALALSVVDNDSYLRASNYLKADKDLIDSIEGYWKEPKSNAYQSWKSICNKENEMKKPLQEVEKKLKKEIADYMVILEEERKKLESSIREETGMEISLAPDTPQVKGTSFQDDYSIIITDESKIPFSINGVQLLKADTSAIKKLVKLAKGNINIPGVNIEKTKIVKVR
jgi:hypothetical protein